MQIEISLFGQLTDIVNGDRISIDEVTDTDQLVKTIAKLYPAMTAVKYIIAVDKKIIQSNTILNNKSSVALLPPFSGG